MSEENKESLSARRPLGRLHVLTDEVLQSRWSHLDLARLAADGGADVVQYRDKRSLPADQRVLVARALRRALPVGVQLVVNDHAEVALAVGADGVHLGRDDLSPDRARRLLGPRFLIGGTANSLEEARRSFALNLDYLGVGPVFGTRSKAQAPPALGLEALGRIAGESPLPVIAIGGITPENLEAVLEAGAWGVAVLSGVTCSDEPLAATARYRAALERSLERGRVRS